MGRLPYSADSIRSIYQRSDTMGVVIEGLNENYQPQTETVTLTGTTAVTTDNTFVRVFRMATDALNVGDITARVTSASGTVVAQIDVGYGQTLMAVYTVPAGKTAYMTALDTTVEEQRRSSSVVSTPYQSRLSDCTYGRNV